MATVATPTFSPVAGFYSTAQSVAISCATGGATIFYTTHGTTPTHTAGVPNGTSQIYTTAVAVAVSETLKALGYLLADTDSAVASAAYHILAISTIPPIALDAVGEMQALTGGVVTGGITNVTDWSSGDT